MGVRTTVLVQMVMTFLEWTLYECVLLKIGRIIDEDDEIYRLRSILLNETKITLCEYTNWQGRYLSIQWRFVGPYFLQRYLWERYTRQVSDFQYCVFTVWLSPTWSYTFTEHHDRDTPTVSSTFKLSIVLCLPRLLLRKFKNLNVYFL